MEILRIENLSFSYPKSEKNAINNIDLSINRGEFVVICGQSGCGKTTLLRLIKTQLAPVGEKTGRILYNGVDIDKNEKNVCEIGYILQNPESQIVTDKVWHELAFGLENLNLPKEVIRRRVSEMASYFGLQDMFRADTDSLSGGQKQLLNLASVLAMNPSVLILDEPTSQLDPITASDFINTLHKLNRDLGITVILSEHRLEEVFPIADKVLLMDNGEVLIYDTPRNIGLKLEKDHKMCMALPSAVRIFNQLGINDQCPLNVNEGRDFLEKHCCFYEEAVPEYVNNKNVAIEAKDIWFRYGKNSPDILKGLNVRIYENEFFCILGGNGVGKTTALNVIAKSVKAYKGKIKVNGRVAYLPQNPNLLFIKEKVGLELENVAEALKLPKEELENIYVRLNIKELLNRNPFDLSGGELQKCAVAKLLLLKPDILLLDEPTKGLDAHAKRDLALILKNLTNNGTTVIGVTHDIEFAAEYSDRCGMFFDGEIISCEVPQRFFAENNFYTTAANRMARNLFPNAITCEKVIQLAKKNIKNRKG